MHVATTGLGQFSQPENLCREHLSNDCFGVNSDIVMGKSRAQPDVALHNSFVGLGVPNVENKFFGKLDSGTSCQQYGDGVFYQSVANQVDVTNLVKQILGSGPAGVAEGDTSGDSLSWTGSQVVNDALANFRIAAAEMEQEFLSVTGSAGSDDVKSPRQLELERLRDMVANMKLQGSGSDNFERGSFWNEQPMQPSGF